MTRNDDGAAMVEFVLLAVVLALPLCYLILAVFDVQNAAYGAGASTREAARVFVRAPSTAVGEQRAYEAASIALRDHGVEMQPGSLSFSCSTTPCLSPGATVRVTYATTVRLPFLPVLGSQELVKIPISSSHIQVVDEYSEVRP
jgi:Flp pilus assembly protein TadG